MPAIYVEPGEDPIKTYLEYKNKPWLARTRKKKILKLGLFVGLPFGAGALWLIQNAGSLVDKLFGAFWNLAG